jgi:hypothetical protein
MPKQHYIGVKMIQAERMDAGTYYATHPAFHLDNGTNPFAPGYRVIYPDGYESWSPAAVFEAAYFPLDDASRITSADVDRFAGPVASSQIDGKSTLASVETLTGFVQHEVSSCVDPANYDGAIGAKIGYERIKSKLWGHMGFLLQWARFGLTSHAEREKAKQDDREKANPQIAESMRDPLITERDALIACPNTEACPPDCGCIVCVTDRRRRTGKGADCDCASCRNARIREAGEAAATTLCMTEASAEFDRATVRASMPIAKDYVKGQPYDPFGMMPASETDGCDAPKEGWIGPQCPKCRDCCRWTEPDASGRSYCTACRSHGSEGLDKAVATIREVVASGKPPHVERMIEEAVQLREKLGKLKAFMLTVNVSTININKYERMKRQSAAMGSYLQVLDERIEVALEGLNKRDTNVAPTTENETNPKETPDHDPET